LSPHPFAEFLIRIRFGDCRARMASAPSTLKYLEMIGCSAISRRMVSEISMAFMTSS